MTTSRRKRRDATRSHRKDRTINARIPEQLDEELRDQAGRLGLSVSTIVRNALLNTFDLVDNIVSDSARIAQGLGYPSRPAAVGEREPDVASPSVLAWQPGVLNVNGVCEQCNTILPRGSRAGIGVPPPPRPAFLCENCLQQLSAQPTDSASSETGR